MIEKIFEQVKDKWNQTTEQGIKDFVEIPALSPDFDKKWEENGVLLKAVEFAKNWVEKQDIKGLSTKIVQEEGFPPCLYVEIEASEGNTAKSQYSFTGTWISSLPTLAGMRTKVLGNLSSKTENFTAAELLTMVIPSSAPYPQ